MSIKRLREVDEEARKRLMQSEDGRALLLHAKFTPPRPMVPTSAYSRRLVDMLWADPASRLHALAHDMATTMLPLYLGLDKRQPPMPLLCGSSPEPFMTPQHCSWWALPFPYHDLGYYVLAMADGRLMIDCAWGQNTPRHTFALDPHTNELEELPLVNALEIFAGRPPPGYPIMQQYDDLDGVTMLYMSGREFVRTAADLTKLPSLPLQYGSDDELLATLPDAVSMMDRDGYLLAVLADGMGYYHVERHVTVTWTDEKRDQLSEADIQSRRAHVAYLAEHREVRLRTASSMVVASDHDFVCHYVFNRDGTLLRRWLRPCTAAKCTIDAAGYLICVSERDITVYDAAGKQLHEMLIGVDRVHRVTLLADGTLAVRCRIHEERFRQQKQRERILFVLPYPVWPQPVDQPIMGEV
jgi:hypothetical protein